MQNLAELFGIENTDPAHDHPFAAGREPKVVDCAYRRVERGLGHCLASEPMPAAAAGIAENAEILRSLQDSFQLEIGILLAPPARIASGSLYIGSFKNAIDIAADSGIANDDKARKLHQSN